MELTNVRPMKILFVDDDESMRNLVNLMLKHAGYEVDLVSNANDALSYLSHVTPDIILSDVMMADMDGFSMLSKIRNRPDTKKIPVILLTALSAADDLVTGLSLGADDYIRKPFMRSELLARIQSKIARPPVPNEMITTDIRSGLLKPDQFEETLRKEFFRAMSNGSEGYLAYISLSELAMTRERIGFELGPDIWKQVAKNIETELRSLDVIGLGNGNMLGILFPDTFDATVHDLLSSFALKIINHTFIIGGEKIHLTPSIGYANFLSARNADEVMDRALTALDHAARHLDLHPRGYEAAMGSLAKQNKSGGHVSFVQFAGNLLEKLNLLFQVSLTWLIGIVIPYMIYYWMDSIGYDITSLAYLIVTAALVLTALLIWVEGFYALKKNLIPAQPESPYPPATAIIAAYLPNEGPTIIETVESFLRIEYPAPLQIILAYNSPYDMPVEKSLKEISDRDPRFIPLRVEQSESKAQNVNTAIAKVHGEFVGIFDADHHPDPDSFTRAWRWLSSGYDIVQGHCVVRNGGASWVSRLVAVEFEAIYAVSHPGRSRLHQFGIFGGSNGFWKTKLLRQTRMHGFMLTEDIDSSIRVMLDGTKIVSDPELISRELAPTSLKALWHQRLRWAQGWHQVSLKHLIKSLASKNLSIRQKFGAFWLLGWREVYPWISLQMFPIILFWIQKYGGVDKIDWLIPIFVITTLFTLSVSPGQVYFSYRLSVPEIREHKGWFLYYFIIGSLFYVEYKNTIARVAQIKELFKERHWRVTPRSSPGE